MIRFADDQKTRSDLKLLCSADDPSACRIYGIYDSYGKYDDIARFWVGYDDGKPYCAVSLYGGCSSVFIRDGYDIQELCAFTEHLSPDSVFSRDKLSLSYSECGTLACMSRTGAKPGKSDNSTEVFAGFCDVPVGEIYALLQSCLCEDLEVPQYDIFASELLHLQHSGYPFCSLVRDSAGNAASFAMVQYISESSAVIGAVCTSPGCRLTGLGSKCVESLISVLGSRTVYIIRFPGRNEGFYSSLGFENRGNIYIYEK